MSLEVHLAINAIDPEITDEQAHKLARLLLNVSDSEWCIMMPHHMNQESPLIQHLMKQIREIRDACGDINNRRVSKYQDQYFSRINQDGKKKRNE